MLPWLPLLFSQLWVSRVFCMKHEEVTLCSQLQLTSGLTHIRAVDGITVMSEDFYTDVALNQTVIVMPRDAQARLMVNLAYLDIAKSQPCTDTLMICELSSLKRLRGNTCQRMMINNFCGSLSELFPINKFDVSEHYMTTLRRGRGLKVQWTTGRPVGKHHGFRLDITAFTTNSFCDLSDHWQCERTKRCIARDLHCDGLSHCVDGTDENVNCTRDESMDVPSLCLPASCTDSGLRWKLHHNTLTLIIPMGLAIVLLLVALMWKYKRMFRHLISGRVPPQSPTVFESSELATAEQECMVHPFDLPMEFPTQEHRTIDPTLGMLLPPPYTLRDGDSTSLAPPTDGDPPPLYEDSVNEDAAALLRTVPVVKAITSCTANDDVSTSSHDVTTSTHNVSTSTHDASTSAHDASTFAHDVNTSTHDVNSSTHNVNSSRHDVNTSTDGINASTYGVIASDDVITSADDVASSSRYGREALDSSPFSQLQ